MILASHCYGKYMAPNYSAIKHIWPPNISYIIWAWITIRGRFVLCHSLSPPSPAREMFVKLDTLWKITIHPHIYYIPSQIFTRYWSFLGYSSVGSWWTYCHQRFGFIVSSFYDEFSEKFDTLAENFNRSCPKHSHFLSHM